MYRTLGKRGRGFLSFVCLSYARSCFCFRICPLLWKHFDVHDHTWQIHPMKPLSCDSFQAWLSLVGSSEKYRFHVQIYFLAIKLFHWSIFLIPWCICVWKGYIRRGRKPVYWSPGSRSALAEAELEYRDHHSTAVYVSLPVSNFSPEAIPLGLCFQIFEYGFGDDLGKKLCSYNIVHIVDRNPFPLWTLSLAEEGYFFIIDALSTEWISEGKHSWQYFFLQLFSILVQTFRTPLSFMSLLWFRYSKALWAVRSFRNSNMDYNTLDASCFTS